jgi:hypothetical protein
MVHPPQYLPLSHLAVALTVGVETVAVTAEVVVAFPTSVMHVAVSNTLCSRV